MRVIVGVACACLLIKRAIVGPQKQFARFSIAAVIVGSFVLSVSEQQDDFMANAGALLILLGGIASCLMVLAELVWNFRKSRWKSGG